MIEGPVREGNLEAEVAAALRSESVSIMEVDSTSMSKDACEAAGGGLALEEATPEASTPSIFEGNILVLIGGEEANGGDPSFSGLIEATARVVGLIREFFTKVICSLLYFFS